MPARNEMENQLREPIEAPTFWRKISLQQGEKVILVEQLVEDFAPNRTTVREEGKTSDIEPNLTIGSIREKHLPPGATTCIVHLKADVDIIFPDVDAPEKFKIHDHRYQQEFEVNEHIVSLAGMQIEGVVQTAEEAYLNNNAPFSDPYQREDPRIVPIVFKTGSEEALRAQLTDLLHAFPRIFEAVPEPRVFVHTEFDSHPASFNIHLHHQGQTWQAENYFLALVKPIIRENTPAGYCYRNGTGAPERRSEFYKDSLFLSIEPETPTQEQVDKARRNTTARFEKYGLTLNPEIFDQNPLRRDERKPPGGRSALMTLLVGLGLLEGLGLFVQNAMVSCAEGEICTSALVLFTHELGLPLG